MPVGSGTNTWILNRTGSGAAGVFGSGISPKVYDKTGFAVTDPDGSGRRTNVTHVRRGFGKTDPDGSGFLSDRTYAKTGSGRGGFTFGNTSNYSGLYYGIGTTAGATQIAQSFTVSQPYTLKTLRVYLILGAGNPTDNVIFEIRTNSGGSPSTTVLGSVTVPATSLTLPGWNTLTLDTSLNNNTYWIVAYRSGGLDPSNYIRWGLSSLNYSPGDAKIWNTSVWTTVESNTRDFMFECYSGPPSVIGSGDAEWIVSKSGAGVSGTIATGYKGNLLTPTKTGVGIAGYPGRWAKRGRSSGANDPFGAVGATFASQFGSTSTPMSAQSFVSNGDYISEIAIQLNRVSSFVDDVVIEIQADNGADRPSGVVLGTNTIPYINIPTTAIASHPFLSVIGGSISRLELVAGTKYWIVVSRTGTLTAGTVLSWYNANADLYPYGQSAVFTTFWSLPGGNNDLSFIVTETPKNLFGSGKKAHIFSSGGNEYIKRGYATAGTASSGTRIRERAKTGGVHGGIIIGYPRGPTTPNTTGIGSISTQTYIAQSFVVPEDRAITISELRVWIQKFGSPTDDLIFEIRTNNGVDPSTTVLGTCTILNSAITAFDPAPPQEIDITGGTIGGLTLGAGSIYWIVVRRSGAISSSNTFGWGYTLGVVDLSSFGKRSTTGTGSWVDLLFDNAFQLSQGNLVGSGVAEVNQNLKKGSGVAQGVGYGTNQSIFVERGFSTVGSVGSGVKEFITSGGVTYTKAGYATAGTVGAGARTGTSNERGYATVSGAGTGASQKISGAGAVYTKSGYATVGLNGYGPKQITFTKRGFGKAGTTAFGSNENVTNKYGSAFIGGPGYSDDFNRSNEDPLANPWSSLATLPGRLILTSNQVARTGTSGRAASFLSNISFDNVEVGITVPTMPTTSFGALVGVKGRVSSPKSALWNGYEFCVLINTTAPLTYHFLLSWVHGGATDDLAGTNGFAGGALPNGSLSSTEVTSGDKIKLVLNGDILEGWHYHSGTWTKRVQATDSNLASGFVGIESAWENASRIDDFVVTQLAPGMVGSGASVYIPFSGAVYTKTGNSTVGTVGAGSSASIFVESGYATVGDIGSGSSIRSGLQTKTGFSTAGTVGAGPSESIFVESGFSTVGTVGTGASASVFVKSGYSSVGGVASGTSESIIVETGFGTVGSVGSGSSQRAGVQTKTGFGTVGTVGSGPSASVFVESAFATVGTVGSGASSRASTYVKSGFATTGLNGYGVSESIFTKSGYATVVGVAAGTRSIDHNRTGFATVGGVATGVDVKSLNRKNFAVVGLNAYGFAARQNEQVKTGRATAGLNGYGADQDFLTETGFSTVGAVATGGSASEYTKTGFSTVGTVATGPSESISIKSSYGTVGTNGYGASSRQGQQTKTGFGTVGTIGAGPSASVFVKSGFSTIVGVAAGTRAEDHIRTGFGTVGTAAFGGSTSEYNKTSFSTVGTVATGSSASEFVETGYGTIGLSAYGFLARQGQQIKTGNATVNLVGSGTSVSVFVKTGYATVSGIGVGARSRQYTKANFAVIGLASYGSIIRSTEFVKTGYSTVGLVARGPSTSIFVEEGYSVVGANGYGVKVKATLYLKTGYGAVSGVTTAYTASIFVDTGYGKVGTVGSGPSVKRTLFSIVIINFRPYRHINATRAGRHFGYKAYRHVSDSTKPLEYK